MFVASVPQQAYFKNTSYRGHILHCILQYNKKLHIKVFMLTKMTRILLHLL